MTPSAKRRHYDNAPITEAVIDIQVENVEGRGIENATMFADRLKEEFPTRLPVFQLQMGFQADMSGETDPTFLNEKQNLGWRLNSKNQTRVLQIRTNGFTYSHLPPYTNWEKFSAEAADLWAQYVQEFQPKIARRLAVRAINRLPVAETDNSLGTILNLYPNIPDELPRDAQGIALQLQLPMKHVDANATLNLGLFTAQVSPGEAGLILDIDLFIERPVQIGEDVFVILNKLGFAKDDVFEACITDTIRERIQ